MLNNINILIIGGDARNIEVINQLSNQKASVYIIGFDKLSFDNKHVHNVTSNEIPFNKLDAILLPVSGSSLKGEIKFTYSNRPSDFITKEMISKTTNNCVIYTGITNSYLNKITEESNRKLVSIFDRDDVAILNSIATAEGALNLAIEETDHTIHGANVLILGFGRIGTTVARLFNSVGAKTHVASRNPVQIARIIEMGCTPIKLADIKEHSNKVDVLLIQSPI